MILTIWACPIRYLLVDRGSLQGFYCSDVSRDILQVCMATAVHALQKKQESNKNNLPAAVLVYRYDILDFEAMKRNLQGTITWPRTLWSDFPTVVFRRPSLRRTHWRRFSDVIKFLDLVRWLTKFNDTSFCVKLPLILLVPWCTVKFWWIMLFGARCMHYGCTMKYWCTMHLNYVWLRKWIDIYCFKHNWGQVHLYDDCLKFSASFFNAHIIHFNIKPYFVHFWSTLHKAQQAAAWFVFKKHTYS